MPVQFRDKMNSVSLTLPSMTAWVGIVVRRVDTGNKKSEANSAVWRVPVDKLLEFIFRFVVVGRMSAAGVQFSAMSTTIPFSFRFCLFFRFSSLFLFCSFVADGIFIYISYSYRGRRIYGSLVRTELFCNLIILYRMSAGPHPAVR